MVDQAKPTRKGIGCGTWVLIGIGAVMVLGWFGSQQEQADKAARVAAADGNATDGKVMIPLTAEQLRAEFAANEVGAKARYQGKRVRIEGVVERVTLDITNTPTISFATDQRFDVVNVYVDKEQSAEVGVLAKGQKLAVVCDKVDEVLATPIGRDCVLAR